MATLDNPQLTRLLQDCEREFGSTGIPIDYTKPNLVDGLQAIEDWFDLPATQAALNGQIEAAAVGVFSNIQKKKLTKFWLSERFKRE